MTIKTLQKFDSMAEFVHWLVNTGRAPDHAAAKRMVPSLIPKEAKFQTAILQYLNSLPHALFWKDSAGAYQSGGHPDISGMINGRYFGFEVKRPLLGRVSPLQEAFHEQIRQAGGQVYVVSYVDEVRDILRNSGVEVNDE